MFFHGLSAVYVIVLTHQVGCLEQLVQVDKGSNNDQSTQKSPQPVVCCTEVVVHMSSGQFSADSIGDFVIPYQRRNLKGDRCHQQKQQPLVHGLFAVIPGCNDIDIIGNRGQHHDAIDAEGD